MSSASFGTRFILVSDVRQTLDTKTFSGGPWEHLATVKRGFKEYVAFRHLYSTDSCFIEEIDIHNPGIFVKIKDDALWWDLLAFLKDAGVFTIDGAHKQAGVK